MRSPDGATSNWGKRHLVAAYYSSIDPEGMKGWVGLVGWPIRTVYPHKWSPVSYRSSAGQRKYAARRPTFYHWATQPCNRRGRRRNYLWQILWWSVQGSRFCGGPKIAIFHYQSQSPLTQGGATAQPVIRMNQPANSIHLKRASFVSPE